MECFTKPYYESLKQLYPIITELYFVFKERAEKQGNAALDNENEALNTADRVISTADNEEVCERITELGAHCEHVGFILGFTAAVKFFTEATGQTSCFQLSENTFSLKGEVQV